MATAITTHRKGRTARTHRTQSAAPPTALSCPARCITQQRSGRPPGTLPHCAKPPPYRHMLALMGGTSRRTANTTTANSPAEDLTKTPRWVRRRRAWTTHAQAHAWWPVEGGAGVDSPQLGTSREEEEEIERVRTAKMASNAGRGEQEEEARRERTREEAGQGSFQAVCSEPWPGCDTRRRCEAARNTAAARCWRC